ncbi:MAG: GNAT family N-acetyltransferase [Spirochaetes bacterium]|jgi:GNAT superfamily N-acetyltransferase|nr:GNAT family N-acetyltransferase [Spirochaetota bacterium]
MAPFELTEELISEVIFAMEDQNTDWFVDVTSRRLISQEQVDEASLEAEDSSQQRYVPVPVWEPADGFQLMERFVDGLHNAELQAALRDALAARRGVFRLFKDALRQYPAFERRWHAFKDQEMRNIVFEWYNDLRSSWGLEPIEIPEEPPQELLLTDVDVREPGEEDLAELEEMRHAAREELLSDHPELSVFLGDTLHRAQEPAPLGEEGNAGAFVAEAAGGGLCGYVCGTAGGGAGGGAYGGTTSLEEIYVWPEYRGLGIGKLLFERFIDSHEMSGGGRPLVQLLGGAALLAPLLSDDYQTVGVFLRPSSQG